MPFYGPWLTAPDRVVRFGYLGDFGVSDGSSYRTSTSTFSQVNAQRESGFGTITTDTVTNEPFAGHSYDGTTWEFQRAHVAFEFHPGADASYVPSAPPPHAHWEFEGTGVGTAVSDFTIIVAPIGYTGGATATQFKYGLFQIVSSLSTIDGTFSYGDATPLTTTQPAGSPDIGGSYPVVIDVWDTLQVDGAPTMPVGAGFVQVASAVVVTIRPPRYRAVYDVPPRLRQFPRDDFLGGTPRQGKTNGPTSVQASPRQGWRGAYR